MTPSPGIEPGPHWWEASALTTAPSLHPYLGEVGKQEILQQMFRKFSISKRLPNRCFPKIDVGCPCYQAIQKAWEMKSVLPIA